jgi:hypothetical protein
MIGVGLVGLMDNLLQPFLIGTKTQLPMLFLFFASVGGCRRIGLLWSIGPFPSPDYSGRALGNLSHLSG